MTPEDSEKIRDMIEDASWRTVAFVALVLGHYRSFFIFLLLPLVLKFITNFVIEYRRERQGIHSLS